MKKLFVSALAILGLVACAKDDVVSVQDNRTAIGFDTHVENVTRVGYAQTSDLTEFDVWAFMGEGVTSVPILSKEHVYDGPNYRYDNTQYWIPGQRYFFAALAPCGAVAVNNASNAGLGVVSFTNDGITDLIYATSTVPSANSNQGAVELQFKHLLSKVKFSFQNGFADPNYTFTVSGITMTAPKSASINLTTGEYTLDGTAGDITLTFGDNPTTNASKGSTVSSDDRLTIPAGEGQVYNITFNVNLYVGGNCVHTYPKTASISGITLEVGKAYNFAAVINPDSLQLNEITFAPVVNGWEEGGQIISNATDLQAALDAAPENATTLINLGADIEGDVTDVQKPGRKVVIDGRGYKYNGTIKVHGNSEHYADAALTIKNVKFETSSTHLDKDGDPYFNFIEALENGSERYSCNITVEDCTFTATGEAVNTAVGVQIKASKNAKVIGCTATNMHSLIQAQSCGESVLVQNCIVVDGKNGVAFKQVKNAAVEGTTITATGYGIRFDGNTDNYGITVKNNNVTAAQPFIVRKMTGQNNTIALEGTNTLTTTLTTGVKYQIVITNGSDDETYVEPTGTYTLTGADNYLVYPAVADYDAFIAKISDDTWYDATKTELAIEDVADFAAFIETANSGNDFEGKTLKLANDIDLYFKDVTAMADGDPVTFRPIGKRDYTTKENGDHIAFKGTFDGQGHSIKRLYQNGWDLGYHSKGKYGSIGLFSRVENATIKNLVIDGCEMFVEGGNVAAIAGNAVGDCTFENITIKNTTVCSYNNGVAGIVAWSETGNYTFKNIVLEDTFTVAAFWGTHGAYLGGVVAEASADCSYKFEKIKINCRLDAYNDVVSNYQWYIYRCDGMLVGNVETRQTIGDRVYPDPAGCNITCTNVTVNYGDWINYHYCESPKFGEPSYADEGEWKFNRVEPGYSYGGIDHTNCNHGENESHYVYIPFDQLFGGGQNGYGNDPVYGLREYPGVTVNYPASYRREVSTAAALTDALNKGVSVILDSDIDFGSTQLAITGENQVVDLGGHALTTANNWGGISLKNGATIKNGTITHTGNTAAIKAFSGTSVENVTINATCSTADKTVTGIAVQQGANVESIKNVTINGVSQGIEVGYQATVGLIEKAVVNESNNGTAKGIGLVINGGMVGKAKYCTFKGETYGITLHLKGVFDAGLELENCNVEGTTASIYAWDEKGISNTSGSLVLTYDAATTLTGTFVWDFEDECQSVVTLNQPN